MCKNSGFRSRIQKSYKKFGIESKNLIIFSESIPNLYPLCFLGLTQIAQISQGFFVGGKSYGCSPILCFLGLTQITQISRAFFVGGKSYGCSPILCFLGFTQIAQISQGFPLWVRNLTEALRFVVFCGLTQIQRDSTR